jgi:hypothetical protein
MLLSTLLAQAQNSDPFGTIVAPAGVERYDQAAGGIGLLLFMSNLIQIATVVAGVWVMFNFITAGYMYVTSNGDSGIHGKVSSKLTQSVIGLVIIVAAYGIAALVGLLMFGDATYFLNPDIPNPTI